MAAKTASNVRRVRRSGGWAYEARWRDANGKDRQRTFATKDAAVTFQAERKLNKRIGRAQSEDKGSQHFSHFAELWLAECERSEKCRDRTLEGYERTLHNHALAYKPFAKPVSRITTMDCEAYMDYLVNKGLSAQTIRHAYRPVAKSFAIAVRHGAIHTNPAQGVQMPSLGTKTKQRKKRRALNAAQQTALFAALDANDPTGYDGLITQTLLDTGVRVAELAGFDIADYDPATRLLDVNKTRTKRNGVWIEQEPKSDKSVREMPVPPALADALDHFVASLHPDPHNPNAPLFPGRTANHKVMTDAQLTTDEPWNPDRYRQVRFGKAVRAAGLPPETRLHDLRHTYGTDLTRAGTPIEVVSRYMGHATLAITFDIYGHLVPKDQRHYIDTKRNHRQQPTTTEGSNVRRLRAAV